LISFDVAFARDKQQLKDVYGKGKVVAVGKRGNVTAVE
jgi:hypothetical protein